MDNAYHPVSNAMGILNAPMEVMKHIAVSVLLFVKFHLCQYDINAKKYTVFKIPFTFHVIHLLLSTTRLPFQPI